MLFLSILLTFFIGDTFATPCVSLAGISHSTTGCPSGEGTPDCTYIQNNQAAICSAILPSWEIVNAPACQLKGSAYGCVFLSGTYTTSDTFCCALGSAAVPTETASATASATATATATRTATATATTTASPSASASVTTSSTGYASPSPSASASATASPGPTSSPSASVSGSPSSSASVTWSSSPSATLSVSSSPTAAVSRSSSASATVTTSGSSTATATSSASPAAQANTLNQSQQAGIGIGAGFVLLLCCGACLRIKYNRKEPELVLQPIALPVTERRKSVAERRKSTTEERRGSVILREVSVKGSVQS